MYCKGERFIANTLESLGRNGRAISSCQRAHPVRDNRHKKEDRKVRVTIFHCDIRRNLSSWSNIV